MSGNLFLELLNKEKSKNKSFPKMRIKNNIKLLKVENNIEKECCYF